jgi:hypothetical protein
MKPLRGGGVHESGVRDGARGWRMAAARGTARLEEQWQLIHPPNGAVSARRPKTPKRWSALRTERSSAEMASPKAMAQRAGLWRRPKPTTAQAPRPRARYAGGIVLPAASPVSSPCSLLSPVCPGLVQQESCASFASHNSLGSADCGSLERNHAVPFINGPFVIHCRPKPRTHIDGMSHKSCIPRNNSNYRPPACFAE